MVTVCPPAVKPVPPAGSNQETERITDLESENEGLRQEIASLHKEIQELKQHSGAVGSRVVGTGGQGDQEEEEEGGSKVSMEHQLVQTQQQLTRALEAVQGEGAHD